MRLLVGLLLASALVFAACDKGAAELEPEPTRLRETFVLQVASGDLDSIALTYERLRKAPMVDLSGLRLVAGIETLAEDPRFSELFPRRFDNLFSEDYSLIHDWHGEGRGHEFGWEARNVGDVDGDEIDDAVVSAPGNQPGANAAGKVYVYSGSSGELLWSVAGDPGDQLGMGIEAAGDVNGDGIPDVVAGAPGAGRAYVYEGRTGEVLLTFSASEDDGPLFGTAVSGAGDVDDDGHADVLVGSPAARSGAGRAYLFSGSDGRSLATLEGLEGEAFGSVVAGAASNVSGEPESFYLVVGAPGASGGGLVRVYTDLTGEPAFIIEPEESARQLGAMFASVVGDVNGDGILDIYASDWADATHGPATGRIYVHSGLDGSRLLTLIGEAAGQGFGIGTGRAGDVDGDGFDDLVIGAWQNGDGAHSGGKVYIYSGKTGELLSTLTGKIPGETFGFDTDGMGDVNGDGKVDFLLTSAWSLVNGVRSGRTMIVSPE